MTDLVRDEKTGRIVKNPGMDSERGRLMQEKAMVKAEEKSEQAVLDLLGSLGFVGDIPEHIMVLGTIAKDGKSGAISALDRLRRLSPLPEVAEAERKMSPVPEPEPESGMCETCKSLFSTPEGQRLKEQLLQAIQTRQKGGPVEIKQNPFNTLAK